MANPEITIGDFETLLKFEHLGELNAFLEDEENKLHDRDYLLEQSTAVWLFSIKNAHRHEVHDVGTNQEEILNLLFSEPLWGFHNLSYDGDFMIKLLQRSNYTATPKPTKRPRTYAVTQLGAKIFQIIINSPEGRQIIIKDTLRFIPYAVADIPKPSFFDFPELAKEHVADYDSPGMYRYTHEPNTRPQYAKEYAEYEHYALMDTLIVYRAMQSILEFIEEVGKDIPGMDAEKFLNSLTLSAFAYALYKHLNPDVVPYLRLDVAEEMAVIHTQEPDVDAFDLRHLYQGGFCDVNEAGAHKHGKPFLKGINSYDLNSAYPSVLKNHVIPVSFRPLPGLEPATTVYHVILTEDIKAKTNLRPLFASLNNMRMDGRQHPRGFYQGSDFGLYEDEYEHCCRLYTNFKKATVFKYPTYGCRCDDGGFIELCYNLKKHYKRRQNKTTGEGTGNQAFYFTAKLLMNSVTGKFGQRPAFDDEVVFTFSNEVTYWGKTYTVRPSQDTSYLVPKKYQQLPLPDRGNNFLMVSYITAVTRCKIYAYVEKIGVERGVYSDTDSIKIFGELDDPTIIGDELGMWEYEKQYPLSCYFRAKCYGTSLTGGTFGGVSQKYIQELKPEDLQDETLIAPAKLVPLHIDGGIKLTEIAYYYCEDNEGEY